MIHFTYESAPMYYTVWKDDQDILKFIESVRYNKSHIVPIPKFNARPDKKYSIIAFYPLVVLPDNPQTPWLITLEQEVIFHWHKKLLIHNNISSRAVKNYLKYTDLLARVNVNLEVFKEFNWIVFTPEDYFTYRFMLDKELWSIKIPKKTRKFSILADYNHWSIYQSLYYKHYKYGSHEVSLLREDGYTHPLIRKDIMRSHKPISLYINNDKISDKPDSSLWPIRIEDEHGCEYDYEWPVEDLYKEREYHINIVAYNLLTTYYFTKGHYITETLVNKYATWHTTIINVHNRQYLQKLSFYDVIFRRNQEEGYHRYRSLFPSEEFQYTSMKQNKEYYNKHSEKLAESYKYLNSPAIDHEENEIYYTAYNYKTAVYWYWNNHEELDFCYHKLANHMNTEDSTNPMTMEGFNKQQKYYFVSSFYKPFFKRNMIESVILLRHHSLNVTKNVYIKGFIDVTKSSLTHLAFIDHLHASNWRIAFVKSRNEWKNTMEMISKERKKMYNYFYNSIVFNAIHNASDRLEQIWYKTVEDRILWRAHQYSYITYETDQVHRKNLLYYKLKKIALGIQQNIISVSNATRLSYNSERIRELNQYMFNINSPENAHEEATERVMANYEPEQYRDTPQEESQQYKTPAQYLKHDSQTVTLTENIFKYKAQAQFTNDKALKIFLKFNHHNYSLVENTEHVKNYTLNLLSWRHRLK